MTLPAVSCTWAAPVPLPHDFNHYNVELSRATDNSVISTAAAFNAAFTFNEVPWGTQVRFRVRVADKQANLAYTYMYGPWSSYSSTVTIMADPKPGTPAVAVDKTKMTVTWAAPAVLPDDAIQYIVNERDPGGTISIDHARELNNRSVVVDELPYGAQRIFKVRLVRGGSQLPSPSNDSTTATAIADPVPRTPTASILNLNTVRATWLAPLAGAPNDTTGYRVRLKNSAGAIVDEATTTGLTYDFSGMAFSTGYKFDVRLERANGQHSTYTADSSVVTTGASPDSTPPAAIAVTVKPVSTYGAMRAQFTVASDTTTYKVQKSVNGGAWADVVGWTATGGSQAKDIALGTHTAGQTVAARVWQGDGVGGGVGNIRYNDSVAYALAASPTIVTADSTNYWRDSNGGEFNPGGTYRPHQGYFSDPSLNATGFIYYGNKIANACAGKTVTAMNLNLKRIGGGNNVADQVRLYMHTATTSPGTVRGVGNHTLYFAGGYVWGTLTYGETKNAALHATFVEELASGLRKGIAVHQPTGKPYLFLASRNELASQGQLQIYHLG